MIAILQRVSSASVSVEGKITGKCGEGYAILFGVAVGDTEKEADFLAQKIAKLRVFRDENDKMNLSINDVGGSCVVVSQFTLLADCSHGNRPSFFDAAPPTVSEGLYEYFVRKLDSLIKGTVECGVFGADMQYEIHNQGPVTIVLDTKQLC